MEDDHSDCYYGNVWVWRPVDDCVTTLREMVGVLCGVTSVFFLLLAHMVVIAMEKTNCHKVRKFPYILLGQTLADCISGLGAMITHQYGIKVYFGLFLILVDVLRLLKKAIVHLFIKCHKGPTDPEKQDEIRLQSLRGGGGGGGGGPAEPRRYMRDAALPCIALPMTIALMQFSGRDLRSFTADPSDYSLSNRQTRTLFNVKQPAGLQDVGFILGIIGAMLDILAKLPIFTILGKTLGKRRCVFSVLITICNTYYILSVILADVSLTRVIHSLPWLLGRSSLIFLELMIFVKHFLNARKKRSTVRNDNTRFLSTSRERGCNGGDLQSEIAGYPTDVNSSRDLRKYVRHLMSKMGMGEKYHFTRLMTEAESERMEITYKSVEPSISSKEETQLDRYSTLPESDSTDNGTDVESDTPEDRDIFDSLPLIGIGAVDTAVSQPSAHPPADMTEFPRKADNGSSILRQVNILADIDLGEEVDLELDEDQIYKILAEEDRKRGRGERGISPGNTSIMAEIFQADEQEKQDKMEDLIRENDVLIKSLVSDEYNATDEIRAVWLDDFE